MLDGHFDYGNGYHGRVYLNPHQLFRHPSTIWRFAQDLIDLLPAIGARADRSRRRTGDRRRAARAHDRRSARQPPRLTHPPRSFAPFKYDAIAAFALRRSTGSSSTGKRVLLADDVRNTGQTFARCAALVRDGRRHRRRDGRDLRSHGSDVDLGVPNIALAEYKAPENYPAAICPMCKAGVPITTF